MKKIIIFLILIIIGGPFVYGEELTLENHTFSISLIVEPICGELQENIFRIERQNHTTGMEVILIHLIRL